MSPQRGKRQQQGPLKGHFKLGRTYRPPLLAYAETIITDWVRDDLPDLLWPAALIALDGDKGGIAFGRLQEAVLSALTAQGFESSLPTLDGRLTSLDLTPADVRPALIRVLEQELEAGALPAPLLAALRLYPDLPGSWLLVEPWSHIDPGLTETQALDVLASVLFSLMRDGHQEALVKFLSMTWLVLRRQITMGQDMIDVLKHYPGKPEQWPLADTMIRSSWGARKGLDYIHDPEMEQRHKAWAAAFWRRNWRLSPCLLQEDGDPQEPESPGEVAEVVHEPHEDREELSVVGDWDSAPELARELVAEAAAHFNRFLEASLSRDTPVDLYDPAQHEVISGLVSRAARATVAILRTPHLWSGEHGHGLIRLFAETRIVLTWLALEGQAGYRKYQDYGRGKAKLQRQRMTELAASFPEEPPDYLAQSLIRLERKLGGDWGEEFIEVNLDSNFAGISVREMASTVGLEDLYRHDYQNASAVAHGEWTTLDDYTMQRCLNPLHRFHLVPCLEPEFPVIDDLARLWTRQLGELVDLALSQLGNAARQIGASSDSS